MTLTAFEEHLSATTGSRHTVLRYVTDVEAFLSFLDGRPLNIGEIESYVSRLNHGARKPQTIGRHLSALRRWIAFEARHGSAEAQSTLELIAGGYKVSPPVRQVDRREVRAVTQAEFDQIMSAPKLRRSTKALLALLWWTGARISEVVGDEVAGIPALSVLDGILLWRQGWTRTRGKGGKIRTLILPQAGRGAIEEQVFRTIMGGGASAGWSGLIPCLAETPLFPSTGSRTVSRQSINRSLHAAAALSGIRQFGGHAFRHAYKARLRQAGVSAELVRALMGHGPRDVTESYGKAGIAELLSTVEKIEGTYSMREAG